MQELRDNFGKRTAEAETLRTELKKEEAILEAAEELLGKLSGEKDRWEE